MTETDDALNEGLISDEDRENMERWGHEYKGTGDTEAMQNIRDVWGKAELWDAYDRMDLEMIESIYYYSDRIFEMYGDTIDYNEDTKHWFDVDTGRIYQDPYDICNPQF